MAYYRFEMEEATFGSFETFYVSAADPCIGDDDGPARPGWYWWPCFPGCLPDGDYNGPFESEAAAIANANEED